MYQDEGEAQDDLPAQVVLEDSKHGDEVQQDPQPERFLHLISISLSLHEIYNILYVFSSKNYHTAGSH